MVAPVQMYAWFDERFLCHFHISKCIIDMKTNIAMGDMHSGHRMNQLSDVRPKVSQSDQGRITNNKKWGPPPLSLLPQLFFANKIMRISSLPVR